jgi:hypothetical protein
MRLRRRVGTARPLREHLVVVGAAVVVPLVACGLGSLDGLSGAAPDGGTVVDESGRTGDDASVEDVAADAPRALACLDAALLCDDFERADPQGTIWSTVSGAPRISTAQSFSPTRSLRLDLPANPNQAVDLSRTWESGFPTRFQVRVRLFAQNSIGSDYYEVLKVAVGPANNWDQISLGLNSGGLQAALTTYDDSPSPTRTTPATILNASDFFGTGWHDVTLTVDLSKAEITLTASVDGQSRPPLTVESKHPGQTSAMLFVGYSYFQGNGPYVGFYIDDVVVMPAL